MLFTMRLFNLAGRLSTFVEGEIVDVATASDNRFSPDPQRMFDDWQTLAQWGIDVGAGGGGPSTWNSCRRLFPGLLRCSPSGSTTDRTSPRAPSACPTSRPCSPNGRAASSGRRMRSSWRSRPTGRSNSSSSCHGARIKVSSAEALSYIAGYTVGQDLSDRVLQRKGPAPQWCLGKSRHGYGPTGPSLVTLDEFDNPLDLAIHSSLGGETLQSSRTSMQIFDVPTVIEYISALCPMLPGDLIFTGTPEGVGYARNPPRFLKPGDELTSTIEGIGDLVTRFTAST